MNLSDLLQNKWESVMNKPKSVSYPREDKGENLLTLKSGGSTGKTDPGFKGVKPVKDYKPTREGSWPK